MKTLITYRFDIRCIKNERWKEEYGDHLIIGVMAGVPCPVEANKKYFLVLFLGNWVYNEGWFGHIVSKNFDTFFSNIYIYIYIHIYIYIGYI